MLLEGTRILDLSQYVLGHYATQILAEQGAEVIRVEQPPRPGLTGKRTSYEREFANNRNKKSLGLNLKTPEGREVFYKLARTADVVFEGFRPGVVKRLCVDYDTIKTMNPRIVYASLSGYGQTGAYRDLVGHDINYLAVSGVLSMLPGMPPLNLLGDMAGGSLFSVVGILMALLARERTGRGQYVDVAMFDGVLSMASWLTRITPQEVDEYQGNVYYNMFQTKDKKSLTIGCIEPHFWENLCRALGHDQFIPYQHDPTRRDEILAAFRKTFSTRTRDEWFEYLKTKDICVGPVLTLDEALTNEHVLSRGMVIEIKDPVEGEHKQIAPALKFSEASPQPWKCPPRPGENTLEIMAALGYTREEIDRLRKTSVVS